MEWRPNCVTFEGLLEVPAGLMYQAGEHAAVADLGGSIITGIDGNPLAVLAAQLGIPLHDINTAGVPLYLEDGRVPDARIDRKVLSISFYLPYATQCRRRFHSAGPQSLSRDHAYGAGTTCASLVRLPHKSYHRL